MVKGVTFGEALECIKQGGTAWRDEWAMKGHYISLAVNITYKNFYGATVHTQSIILHATSDIQVGWFATQADMLANDWCVHLMEEKTMIKCATFGEALEHMKTGGYAAREGWNGKGQYLSIGYNIRYDNRSGQTMPVDHETMGSRAIIFHGTVGMQVGWLASQADMLSEDWVLLKGDD